MRTDSRRFLSIIPVAILLTGFLLTSALCPPSASAFFSKRKTKPETHKKSFASETSDYFIFFNVAKPIRPGVDPSLANMLALDYKIVDRNGNLQIMLNEAEGGRIRFLDKEGFVIAESSLLAEDFKRSEFYGATQIEPSRVKRLVKADIVPLKPEAVEKLRQERESAAAAASAEEERKAAEIAAKEKAVAEAIQAESQASAQPQPEQAQEQNSFERGGVTNEDVQKVLEEFDKQKPTLVEPSKDSIDLKAEAAKEENT